MNKLWMAVLLCLYAGLANATGTEFWIAYGSYISAAASYVYYAAVAYTVYSSVEAQRKARAAAAKRKAEYNSNLTDRSQTMLQANPAHRVVYGQCLTGGDVVAVFTTDKTSLDVNGDPYFKADAYKHIVVHIASHECESIEEIFIDGIPVGTLNTDGTAKCTSFGTGKGYVTATSHTKGATSISVATGTGTILVNDEISFPGETKRYQVVTGITGPGSVIIAAPGLLNDVPSGSTVILGTEFNKNVQNFRKVVVPAGGSVTVPVAVNDILSSGSFQGTTGESTEFFEVVPTLSTDRLTITNPDTTWDITVGYSIKSTSASVRIQKHLGTDAQTVDTFLNGLIPVEWTSNHRLRGLTYVIVTIDLEEQYFQSWAPSGLVFDVKGRKVYDPRSATTYWSNNAALCIRDYLLGNWGFECADADIDSAQAIAAANACDDPIDLLVGTDVLTGKPRYVIDGVVLSSDPAESVLNEMATAMAGEVVYGAQWLIQPGVWTAPVTLPNGHDELFDDDLDGAISITQVGEGLDTLFNGVRGNYIPAGRSAPVDFQSYQNSTFVTADGRELWTNVDLPFTNNKYRARNIARILTEKNRDGLSIQYPAKLIAWPLQVGDRIYVTSVEMGWTRKAFRVTDWQFGLASPVTLGMVEDGAAAYDDVDATSADPSPNSNLPRTGFVNPLKNMVATSGDATLKYLQDGSVIPRVKLTWDLPTDSYVTDGSGYVMLGLFNPGAEDWIYSRVPGDNTEFFFEGVHPGDVVVIGSYVVNGLGTRSDYVFISHTVVGKTTGPSNVTSFDWHIKPAQVVLTWDRCLDIDYGYTELRVGVDWDTYLFVLWSGKATEYHHPRPDNGTYPVWAKHVDTSGNYSATAAGITVTVDDSIDGGTGGSLKLTANPLPYFLFADGTTHTSASPMITFTATPIRIFGTATFVAEAFNLSGTSLGFITLGGSGNARTMTAAQFVAPGTSGSVRRVRVTASIGAVSDFIDVFRQDSTTTAPKLYLSNQFAAVPTDEAGEFGNYADAKTFAWVFSGLTDLTSTYTFSITPDAGVTTTINGGAGPVTGTGTVQVVVSNMTINDGAVLITAVSGVTTLTETFSISKQKANGSGYAAFFVPRTEILLPVLANGSVGDYTNAWSDLEIIKGGTLNDTPQWTITKTADVNVVSTLTGTPVTNRVTITSFPDLGETGTASAVTVVNAAGWVRPQSMLYTGTAWLVLGYDPSTPWATIQRSTDFTTWTDINTGFSGHWEFAWAGSGKIIIPNWSSISNNYIYSIDDGLTWAAGNFGTTAQRSCGIHHNGTFIIGTNGSVTGRKSTDLVTWSNITFPDVPDFLQAVPGYLFCIGTSGNVYVSTNTGTSWSAAIPAIFGCIYIRAVAGRMVAFGFGGSLCKYSENGVTWYSTTMAQPFASGMAQTVRSVLYAVGTDSKLQYTVDGIRWVYKGGTGYSSVSQTAMRLVGDNIDDDHIRALNVGGSYSYAQTKLLATSDIYGEVKLHATKPGTLPIDINLIVRRGTPNSDLYAYFAEPGVCVVPATSDGVVTSFSGATITFGTRKNNVDDTSNFSFSWTATHLTPSSGSTNVATFTAMDAAYDVGNVVAVATKPGTAPQTINALVMKYKGPEGSGPRIGAAYSAAAADGETLIGFKFKTDGRVQVKRGVGGTYSDYTQWAGAVLLSHSSFWLKVDLRAGTHALSSGTTGVWLAMTSDRTFEMSDATSGIHVCEFFVNWATDNVGTGSIIGAGAMQLTVP